MATLEQILTSALSEINSASDLASLGQIKVNYLGKKGQITELLKNIGKMEPEQRKSAGKEINDAKLKILELISKQHQILEQLAIEQKIADEAIDITLPGRSQGLGSLHPISLMIEELRDIFSRMGYELVEGPEIEDDYHNFEGLNFPPHHPARAMQDTLYFADGYLLRSHVSSVQIRAMRKLKIPLRMIAIGRVYRNDFDITHTPMFHQIEGLYIDKNVSMAHLKGLLTSFLRAIFSNHTQIRFRPSFFPFTEPSAEVDMSCVNCKAQGCRICKGTGWLEILGCGMVHPNVLEKADINSKIYSGFAFGLGIDRLAMLKYGITDLRSLFENDVRFLKQF